jgi:hypothetical protein
VKKRPSRRMLPSPEVDDQASLDHATSLVRPPGVDV